MRRDVFSQGGRWVKRQVRGGRSGTVAVAPPPAGKAKSLHRMGTLERVFDTVFGDKEDEPLKREIMVPDLLEGIEELKKDVTNVKRFAHRSPGYWLTLIGLFAMAGRALNAVVQLAENKPLETSGWYQRWANSSGLRGGQIPRGLLPKSSSSHLPHYLSMYIPRHYL